MNSIETEYKDLIFNTLEYLRQEYDFDDAIICDDDSIEFFRSLRRVVTRKNESITQEPSLSLSSISSNKNLPKFILSNKKQQSEPVIKEQTVIIEESKTENKPQISPEFSEEIKIKIEKILPLVKIIREIPCDDEAVILSEEWKQFSKQAEVLLFSFSETKEEKNFLINVQVAIEANFCSCKIIEAKDWESKQDWQTFFQLHKPKFIFSSSDLFKTKKLLTFFKENSATKQMTLSSSQLILLKPIAEYLTFAENKKSLWKLLCNLLSKAK